MKIYKNINIKNFNSLHIDYLASLVIEVHNIQDVYISIFVCNHFKINYIVIGNGSKIVFKDYHIKNPIILINKSFNIYNEFDDKVLVSSGYKLNELILKLANKSKGGFQKLYPIPGCVGGSVYMNAGINKYSIGDFIDYVITIDKSLKFNKYNNTECNFKYRSSIFQKNNEIILLCCLKIKKIKKDIIFKQINEEIIYRLEKQGNYPYSIGSLFKNDSNYNAYEIIKKLNLDNLNVNDISFSDVHCNILINNGNASNSDVITFINLIKYEVKNKLNIDLIPEINIK